MPLWYGDSWPSRLASATETIEPSTIADPFCGTQQRVTRVLLVTHRVDVTGTIVDEREEWDYDARRRVVCMTRRNEMRTFDITSGSPRGSFVDSAVLRPEARGG